MNEESYISPALKPCSSEPSLPEPPVTADSESEKQCGASSCRNETEIGDEPSSADAVESEGVNGEDGGQITDLPLVAAADGGTIQEVDGHVELTVEAAGIEIGGKSSQVAMKFGDYDEGSQIGKEEELAAIAEEKGEPAQRETEAVEKKNNSGENENSEGVHPVCEGSCESFESRDDDVQGERNNSGENVKVEELSLAPEEVGEPVESGVDEAREQIANPPINVMAEGASPVTEEGRESLERRGDGEEKHDSGENLEFEKVSLVTEEGRGSVEKREDHERNDSGENMKDEAVLLVTEESGMSLHRGEEKVKVEKNDSDPEQGGEFIGLGEVLADVKTEALNLPEVNSEVFVAEEETGRLNENDGKVIGFHEVEEVTEHIDGLNGEDERFMQVNPDKEMPGQSLTDSDEHRPADEEFQDVSGEEQTQEMSDLLRNGDESLPDATRDDELIGEDVIGDVTEETGTQTEMDMDGEGEMEAMNSGSSVKRKRGKNSRVPAKASTKIVGEDVCFICLDGGDLVLCDRRGCPKAYHPSCVNRDEAFFRAKGRWNCGWHLCSRCEKNAYYMCCTCAFSLCRGCIKDAAIFCIRGNKGLCETCMKNVMLIENNEGGNSEMMVFDDKSYWEYLFKDYWMEQKEKLSFTSEELAQAKNPWKGGDADHKQETPAEMHEANTGAGNGSDHSFENVGTTSSQKKKKKKQLKSTTKEISSDTDSPAVKPDESKTKRTGKRRIKSQSKGQNSDSEDSTGNQDKTISRRKRAKKPSKNHDNEANLAHQTEASVEGVGVQGSTAWASKELLELVMHMKNGDSSALSPFEVQALLLEYIKLNNLRDPRQKSQIICDSMLEKLFGKPRVAHFEMLKLLESHFLVKEDSQADDNQGSVVDTEVSQLDIDENTESLIDGRPKGKRARKKGEERGLQSNLDDYASIDMHNINLIFLRRNLMETLLEDSERFHDKVVGSFVRIRISGSGQKHDIYRLVQVVGTSKAGQPYKVGKRTTDTMLEILNLDKTETVSIETISNQEFTEDECKRLRQSIKCGLITRLTVGDILEKAKELHEVRAIDWLESEIQKLRHLCDRASDLGRKRELRECVEKLHHLQKPEERQRKLNEVPEVHADPNMDPSYESEDENEIDNRSQESNFRQREFASFRRGRDQFSSRKGGSTSNDPWSATAKLPNRKWEMNRGLSDKGSSSLRKDSSAAEEVSYGNTWRQGVDRSARPSHSCEKPRTKPDSIPGKQAEYSRVMSNVPHAAASDTSHPVPSTVAPADASSNRAEKVWHYRDPSGKVQGPFSIVQLRKWNRTGYFPNDLKIWRISQNEGDSVLLTEALTGRFSLAGGGTLEAGGVSTPHILPSNNTGRSYESPLEPGNSGRDMENARSDQSLGAGNAVANRSQPQSSVGGSRPDIASRGWAAPALAQTSKTSTSVHVPDSSGKYDSSNLPSPTPARIPTSLSGKQNRESRWSAIEPRSKGGNAVLPSSTGGSSESNLSARPSDLPSSEASRGMDGSHMSQRSSREATVAQNREVKLVLPNSGFSVAPPNANTQQISSQPTVCGESTGAPMMTYLPPPPPLPNGATSLVGGGQGVSNIASSAVQNHPPVYGWGPAMANPAQVSGNTRAWAHPMPPNNSNVITAQQTAYGFWPNPPVNNLSQPYSAGQFVGPGNLPSSNFSAMPSPNSWRPSASPAASNMPWGMAAAPDNPGVAPAVNTQWGPMPANANMGWCGVPPGAPVGAVLGPTSTAMYGQPPGGALGQQPVGTPVAPGVLPGSSNMSWSATGNANPGWAAPTGNPGAWPNEQNPNGGGGGGGGGHRVNQSSFGNPGPTNKSGRCKFHGSGNCRKGASCEYLHS